MQMIDSKKKRHGWRQKTVSGKVSARHFRYQPLSLGLRSPFLSEKKWMMLFQKLLRVSKKAAMPAINT